MIRFNELKIGDIIQGEFEGQWSEGEVVDLNREDKEVCVRTQVQDFWYKPEELMGIPVSDKQLSKFGFEREADGPGPVKYKKGAFRIMIPEQDDFNEFEMWYREDRRHIKGPIAIHELQNHYRQMTKVELIREITV